MIGHFRRPKLPAHRNNRQCTYIRWISRPKNALYRNKFRLGLTTFRLWPNRPMKVWAFFIVHGLNGIFNLFHLIKCQLIVHSWWIYPLRSGKELCLKIRPLGMQHIRSTDSALVGLRCMPVNEHNNIAYIECEANVDSEEWIRAASTYDRRWTEVNRESRQCDPDAAASRMIDDFCYEIAFALLAAFRVLRIRHIVRFD